VIDFLDPHETLAYALGIPLYVDDAGRVTQFGPGRRIDPDPNALPRVHGATLDSPATADA
jgi:hypothetical protein